MHPSPVHNLHQQRREEHHPGARASATWPHWKVEATRFGQGREAEWFLRGSTQGFLPHRPVRSMSLSQDRAVPQGWRSAAIARWRKWHWTRYRPCGTIGHVGGWPPILICGGRVVERHCLAVPIGSKAEAKGVVNEVITKLERQLGDRVCVIRSDGGTEFASGEAIEWYRTTGIQHYTSPRYTPELNGAAVRMVRTLKEMTASLLVDSKLPSTYWSYAARYAAVVLMKTSAKNPSACTRLTGRGSGIESVHRFGQRCFVQVPREVRRKIDLSMRKASPESS
jgi:hypothetical protein